MMHENERYNLQHCWRSFTEMMHSSTVILAMRVGRRFHESNIVAVRPKRRNIATFRKLKNKINVGTYYAKRFTG